MPTLLQATPVLAAQDIAATLAFYQAQLGFMPVYQADDYGIAQRDDIEIHFWQCAERHIAENTSCRITVTKIDALYADLSAKGLIHPNGQLEEKPWGLKEFPILDLNGNLIWFIQAM